MEQGKFNDILDEKNYEVDEDDEKNKMADENQNLLQNPKNK